MPAESVRRALLDVVIVGAGAAGIGCAVVLRAVGAQRLAVLERGRVGQSFEQWPEGMRFITPSFTSNQFGSLDLNAVAIQTSPAFTLRSEHPTGTQYAGYLRGVAKHFGVRVRRGIDVQSVTRRHNGPGFVLHTTRGIYRTRMLVWAAGEFQHPRTNVFPGADLCTHTSHVRSWQDVAGDPVYIIGGSESGIDAATHLATAGRHVVVLDARAPWTDSSSDPSLVLSPFTLDRLHNARGTGRVELFGGASVTRVVQDGEGFRITTTRGESFLSDHPPLLATGFLSSATGVADHFAWTDEGTALLTADDESTTTPGLFLVGPSVRHERVILCFIYKFRQRFAVVARAIGTRLGLDLAPLEEYRRAQMFLDDLSCCGVECQC